MAELVLEHMHSSGTTVVRGVTPQSVIKSDDNKIKVSWRNGEGEFDTVLLAIGKVYLYFWHMFNVFILY